MLTTLRTGRRNLTVPPQFEALPVPHAFTMGPSVVHDIGLAHAQHPPLDLTPTQLGPATGPALHYTLGDGTAPEAWATLQQLTQHLKQASQA